MQSWLVILRDTNSKKHKIINCSQLKVNLALSSCPLGFLTNHSWLTQLDVVCKDPEDQYSRAMSDQGKGIPSLMALCGKCLVSCNSNLKSQCVLGDLICHKERDNCYGYQPTWTVEGSGIAPVSRCFQVSLCLHMWAMMRDKARQRPEPWGWIQRIWIQFEALPLSGHETAVWTVSFCIFISKMETLLLQEWRKDPLRWFMWKDYENGKILKKCKESILDIIS